MRKISVLIISFLLMSNRIYACFSYIAPKTIIKPFNEQCLTGRLEGTITDILMNITKEGKNIKIATQEGKMIIVLMRTDMLVHMERIENDGDFNVNGMIKEGIIYIAMSDLRNIFRARVYWNKETNKMIVAGYKTKIEITAESKLINVREKEISMDAAPIITEDECYLPIRGIAEAFGREAVYSYEDNQHVLSIQPVKVLQNITDIEKVLFFKSTRYGVGKISTEPFLILKKQTEIEFFAQLINNAQEMGGFLDVIGSDYIVKVYYKDKIVNFCLSMSNSDPSPYGGFYLNPKDNHIGYGLQKNDVRAFLKAYNGYFYK